MPLGKVSFVIGKLRVMSGTVAEWIEGSSLVLKVMQRLMHV